MPPVDIWKETPELLRGEAVQQVLIFAGDAVYANDVSERLY
jgi:hypothetical protein